MSRGWNRQIPGTQPWAVLVNDIEASDRERRTDCESIELKLTRNRTARYAAFRIQFRIQAPRFNLTFQSTLLNVSTV